jgi:magnesium-protoporphyrin IX monomethyl ester (oxidative) cyclase
MKKHISRVLLFMPPAITNKTSIDINPAPPLGLGYIASVLESMGKKVKIVDCLLEGWNDRISISDEIIRIGLSEESIKEIIREFNPDIVSVNSQFTRQYKNAHEIYRITKSINPEIITIAGGAHPSVLPEFALHDENLDFVVLGEGEQSIKELVSAISTDLETVSSIDGIGYKTGGSIHVNSKTCFIEDLDSIISPAWHLMNVERYFGLDVCHGKRTCTRFFSIITSRGCPARCVFCTAFNVWGRKYRARSVQNVVDEIKFLKQHYNIEELLIEDDNFTFDVERAEQICDRIIDENLNIRFDTPNGIAAYKLTPQLLLKMKNAGFERINLAIESGNQEALLKIIKKPLMLEKVEEIVDYCQSINLEVGAFFIIGIPGTTIRQMWDNYRFCRKLKLFEPFISVATPYPGSDLYKICKEHDCLSKDFNLEDLYIRKFSISTKEWGECKLRALMTVGYLYLKFFQALENPVLFSIKLKEYIKMRIKNN